LLQVLEQLPLRQHALVQDSADEDPVGIRSIDHNVFPMLDAPVSRTNLLERAPHLRSLNQPLEAIVKAIEVALRLALTPPVQGVFGNLNQVEPGLF